MVTETGGYRARLNACWHPVSPSQTSTDESLQLGVVALQRKAKLLLTEVQRNERSYKWQSVVDNYQTLIKIIVKKKTPLEFRPPASKCTLLFEIFYHLGIAYQHLSNHEEALIYFTKALESVSELKPNCTIMCQIKTCLQTPILARRAFASVVAGHRKDARKDIEEAVVFDKSNPDIYCVRALVLFTLGYDAKALKDCNKALSISPTSAAALVIRGAIHIVLEERAGTTLVINDGKVSSEDHRRAIRLNSDASNYLEVSDFNHPRAINFYERLLFSLNVPHTVTARELITYEDEIKEPFKIQIPPKSKMNSSSSNLQNHKSFRCGSANRFLENSRLNFRKFDYDLLVKTNTYMQSETKEMSSSNESSTKQSGILKRPKTSVDRYISFVKSLQEERSKKLRIQSATSAFKPLKLHAPRMYIKPWSGDNIPVLEDKKVIKKNTIPWL